ncbi:MULTISPECIES: MFS transporter [Brevibacterium]|uniref:Major facilitator superfamily MFS_1 n=2 Tax=Brevibacterium TaxID=1696 RepID=A0A0B9A4W5_BRELN|nr:MULTISPECIES: MFS transporter [Brevibacterium]KHS53868.1 major facilitator superfamily MFS_1 [Brevibacterium linens]SMX82801.1 Predicted arabinose efflux permease, MFS family [Brevibacterium aurantiacum]
MTAGRTNEASSSHTNQRDLNRVAVSSLLGTSMEWYDYFLYGLFAALIFDKLFFPELPGAAGSVMALLTFAIGFVARPLGGVIFGHLGDRVGRKSTLIITLTVIGGATGLIGCLPTYSQIGVAAPIILASLRFIQGLSLGGEWGGAVLMVVEHAPKDKRAIYGAMPQLGSPIGTVLSSGVIAIVTLLPDEALMSWGWRLPFLLSFLMLAIALYMRLRVEESPVFKQLQAEADYNDEAKVKIPLFALLRSSLPQMALVIITCFFASGGFFLMTTYAVNYSTNVLGMTASLVLVATMVGAVLEAVGVVIGGRLGDRYSPASVVAGGGLLALIMIVPITFLISSGSPLLAATGIALGIGVLGIPYGPLGTLLSQLFDETHRYSGVAVSYNIAGLIGGFVPSLALALQTRIGDTVWVIGILFAIIVAMTAVGGWGSGAMIRRTRRRGH